MKAQTMEAFIADVMDMRRNQKAYKNMGKMAHYEAMRKFEKKVDKHIQKLLAAQEPLPF